VTLLFADLTGSVELRADRDHGKARHEQSGALGRVSPTGHVPGALLVRVYLLLSAYAALRFHARGEWRITSST
jgi:hypothetical protein